MNTNLVCRTKNTTVKFSCTDDSLFINVIILNGSNRSFCSSVEFPKKYRNSAGETVPFAWTLRRELPADNGFTLLYSDDESCCTYRVTAKGRTDIDGPIEYFSALYNTTGDEIRIFPDEVFSVGFSFDKTPTSWRFVKESGVAEGVKWHLDPSVFFPGTGIYKDEITSDTFVTAVTNTNQDFNQGGMIPIIYLDGGDHGAYVAFEWTSSRIIAKGTSDGVRVSVDFREDFTTRIKPGDEFIVPPIYIGVYDGDIDRRIKQIQTLVLPRKNSQNHAERS